MEDDLSLAEARRVVLTAQGFAAPAPKAVANAGHLRRLTSRLHAIQIDAVNVLVRAHYLPAYSRLGPYRTESFDRLAFEERALFEYAGHAASFLPIELHPLLRWRMARSAEDKHWNRWRTRVESERPGYVAAVEQEIADRGPRAFGDLADPARREKVQTKYAESSILWWRWSDGKTALDYLFHAGRLAVARRGGGFEPIYDLAERVIPPEILGLPTPADSDAIRGLVLLAGRALGVATVRDLADYFRLPLAATRAALHELVESGDLLRTHVEGWSDDAYLSGAGAGSAIDARALISPFDSLVWERARTERLFGFRYRIEIYVPAAKRQYGYYVLPFLLGDRLVARVDLKADRKERTLLVPGAFLESMADGRQVVPALVAELRRLAGWLGLARIEIGGRGDLAASLKRARP
ncbi:MAG: winged helix-turn-helix domain-containing protein [Acidimicrobiales bacterium]